MKMRSKSTLPPQAKARTEFRGDAAKVKKAQKADEKSDKALAKRYGVKYTG